MTHWITGRAGIHTDRVAIFFLTAMVFSGAILLFSMEPLVGRLLIPYFGGAAHIWLTCLMFFQAMLFIGYLYSHLLVRKLGGWHLIMLGIPLISLPLKIMAVPDAHAPLQNLLFVLSQRVALPFIALSTTAVAAQTWLIGSSAGKDRNPYPLYAASNAGSLIALLGYAFLIEPLSGIHLQSIIWSIGYLFYIGLVVVAWLILKPQKKEMINPVQQEPGPGTKIQIQWLLISALPSAFLLATTNFITLEIGSFPFVWVLPLALYLGSFIITFRDGGGVPKFLKRLWLESLLIAFSLYFWGHTYWVLQGMQLIMFFVICLVAHGTLYELRPPKAHLTRFYLVLAFGGWVGGAFVSLIAPKIFSGLFEYPMILILFGILFWLHRDKSFISFWVNASRPAAWSRMIAIGIIIFPVAASLSSASNTKFRYRNFYGTYEIKDVLENGLKIRQLVHGKTLHGSQFLENSKRLTPISYYFKDGPIYEANELSQSPRKMAVLGLGSGSISAYAHENDQITYYEIDPDNEKIARRWFTFLDECKGDVNIKVGDGRLSLQNWDEDRSKYDLIIMDTFTGDGIPTHLLTEEAISIYLNHLNQNGIIIFHISNRYYDLRPVLKATSGSLALSGVMNVRKGHKDSRPFIRGILVVLARDRARLQPLISHGWIPFGNGDGLKDIAPWTDDHIDVLAPLALRFIEAYLPN